MKTLRVARKTKTIKKTHCVMVRVPLQLLSAIRTLGAGSMGGGIVNILTTYEKNIMKAAEEEIRCNQVK